MNIPSKIADYQHFTIAFIKINICLRSTLWNSLISLNYIANLGRVRKTKKA